MSEIHPVYQNLLHELTEMYQGRGQRTDYEFTLPVERYTDQAIFEQERALLRRVPMPVAHASQLRSPGSCLVHDALGVPILISRDRDGELVGMLNVCRHRGTRLIENEGFCQVKKGFTCPYHGWTYDLAGKLVHVPQPELFPSLDKSERSLVSVPVAERGGLIWLVATPGIDYDFDSFLGPLIGELDWLGIGEHIVFRRAAAVRKANWKLVVEAFLDGYHVEYLHKKTVAPYFKGLTSYSEFAGPHVRSIVGRSNFSEALQTETPDSEFRSFTTPTYIIFPSTVLVVQPDFISRATIYPTAVDEIYWEHDLIIPEEPRTEKVRAHWELNFKLIAEGVFESEDLWVCEQIQKGIQSGANRSFNYGGLEKPIEGWHRELTNRLEQSLA